ncbi:MAG: ATP-binding cassette domain-containing protein [Deltaproteobacteria bacterium]|nr:ATP-binding cassette domain-containing protein [Deltaproteobacteria bacterium]
MIKGIDFDVYEGEIVGLVGPNGAGKTTFLETIAGTIKSKAGKIFWRQKCINSLSVMARRKLGIMLVPQEAYIFPMMTVKANLEVTGIFNNHTETKRLMAYVHEIFPVLRTREKQIANTLSGGERKMLAVGMGIISNAKLIMIDEPSIGLAPKLVTKLLENLKKIKEDTGRTLVLAEQNVKILNVADRIYGLEAGEMRFCDKTQNLDETMVAELYMGK